MVTYKIMGFASGKEAEALCQDFEFITEGKVIVGYRHESDEDPKAFGNVIHDDYYDPLLPVYDETDRSKSPYFELATALYNAGSYLVEAEGDLVYADLYVRQDHVEQAAKQAKLEIK